MAVITSMAFKDTPFLQLGYSSLPADRRKFQDMPQLTYALICHLANDEACDLIAVHIIDAAEYSNPQ